MQGQSYSVLQAPVGRARWARLIPVAIIIYIVSFMDRTNIGFAFSGMEKDLGFGATAARLSGEVFFIGYMLLQIPS